MGQPDRTAAHRYALKAAWLLPLAALSLGLCVWKLACIRLGPDPDVDAYGHYVIGRQLLETPLNLRIHWVWLPFYHAFLALAVVVGASLEHVRVLNALLSTLTPLLLLAIPLRGIERSPAFERFVPYLGALVAAAFPIAVQMGTSAQPESLFSALLLGGLVLLAREHHLAAALALSVAVLTRYEGWVALAAIGAVLGTRALVGRRWPARTELMVVLGPLAMVLAWTLARWAGGEPWLGFLSDNQRFAEGALAGRPRASLWQLLASDGRTPGMALAAAVALLGVPRTLRRHGALFVAVPASVIAFLVFGYFNRSHLGLERHLVAPSPFLALWLAHGLATVSELAQRVLRRARARELTFGVLSAVCALALAAHTSSRLRDWEHITAHALPERLDAAGFVGNLPASAILVCDEASVEVLSGLPKERFLRQFVTPAATPSLLELTREAEVYAVSWRSRMSELMRIGSVMYESAESGGDALMAVHLARMK